MKLTLLKFIKELSASDGVSQGKARNTIGSDEGGKQYYGIKNFNSNVFDLVDGIVNRNEKKIVKLITTKGNIYFVNYTNKSFMDVADSIVEKEGIVDYEFVMVGIGEVGDEYKTYLTNLLSIYNNYKNSLIELNKKHSF